MSSDDGGWGEPPDDQTPYDLFQEDHGDESYHEKNPQYDELGLDKWTHRDPQGEHGGIAWGEAEHYSDHDQAKERYDELLENMNNLSLVTGGQGRELAEIHLYQDNMFDWKLEYRTFIRGARGDSPGKKRRRR